MAEEQNNKFSGKRFLVLVSYILFAFNAWKFLNNPGSDVPILSILFNMIIYLGLVIFIIYKRELMDEFLSHNNKKINFYKLNSI